MDKVILLIKQNLLLSVFFSFVGTLIFTFWVPSIDWIRALFNLLANLSISLFTSFFILAFIDSWIDKYLKVGKKKISKV